MPEIDLTTSLYDLRDAAYEEAAKLRAKIAEAQENLDRLDKYWREAERAAELLNAEKTETKPAPKPAYNISPTIHTGGPTSMDVFLRTL